MRTRPEKIARMLAVRRQLHRLEEWKLMQLQRREADLRDQERDLIGSLNAEVPVHGMFVQAMSKRLTAIGREAGVVDRAKRVQTRVVLDESRKLKHIERLDASIVTEEERMDEKRRLEETIGDAVMRALWPPRPPGRDN